MKTIIFTCAFSFFSLCLFSQTNIKQANQFAGRMAKIDVEKLSSDSYEKGVAFIKFRKNDASQVLASLRQSKTRNQNKVGLVKVDRLNENYGVKEINALFPESESNDYSIKKRHADWELDSWYLIRFDPSQDVKQLIKEYSQLNEVESIEPVFKIVKYCDVNKDNHGKEPITRNYGSEFYSLLNIDQPSRKEVETWQPNDPEYNLQAWHYGKLELEKAWPITKGSTSVIVSVHDGGIQYSHPDLQASIWDNIGPDGLLTNADSHGTHVAGTIAANSNNGIGVAGIAGGDGSNSGVKLMSIDIFNGSLSNYQGYVYAADNGSSISQNSWGYKEPKVYNQPDLVGIDYFNANGGGNALSGGLVIFAAGNDGTNDDWYPGKYPTVIAVAATDQQDKKASFSNYGDWVDISAPGVAIYSTNKDNGYTSMQGTSMACPHVSGVAALILSKYPNIFTNSELRSLLQDYSQNIDGIEPLLAGLIGKGRLNAYKPLRAIDSLLVFTVKDISISATETEITASWNVNNVNDSTLILLSTKNYFSTPTNIYTEGMSMPNGDIVAYIGKENNKIIGNLTPGTTYYLKFFAKKDNGTYSLGKTLTINTACGKEVIPYELTLSKELPMCWATQNTTGKETHTWKVGSYLGGLVTTNDNYAYLDSRDYENTTAENAEVISPQFNFSTTVNAHLQFSHYYRHGDGSKATLSYSEDNGSTWQEIKSWVNTTTNPASEDIQLSNIATNPSIRFKWSFTYLNEAQWSFDKVKIVEQTQSATDNKFNNIQISPIPVKTYLYIQLNTPIEHTTYVKVYNVMGQLVLSKKITNTNEYISFESISPGLYVLKIEDETEVISRKIIVE